MLKDFGSCLIIKPRRACAARVIVVVVPYVCVSVCDAFANACKPPCVNAFVIVCKLICLCV